ncbi:hypothetical protein BDQ12DRAFT_674552 [Crucibulum laeve]|uniref:Uncharacterized protein n=1 Tax=Crucibulum laeve TaxID=68775 RepID=A0A5C3MPQ2_9AGAR|nr:hypothetical protein BDQ12DRAFT_674552 [Crucibulum laeve]
MPSQYTTSESPVQLWYERSNYTSAHVFSVGYGIHIVIFMTVTYFAIIRRRKTLVGVDGLFSTHFFL